LVGDPTKMLDQYDLICNDMAGVGGMCDKLAKKGKLVLGGGSFNDKLELDREYGQKVAQSLTKTKSPHTVTIEKPNELMKFFKDTKKAHVVKPLGNKSPKMTLVSKDKNNTMLKSVVEVWADDLTPCIVQDTIDGVEISTEGWFNGKNWVTPFNHTMENKRLMEGNKGVQTGCMGNLVWGASEGRLIESVLKPLTPLLEKVGFIGPLDVNCIVDKDEAYFLEWTPRFGYDAIQAWSELIKAPLFDYLYGIATQQKDSFNFHDGYGMAVRMSVSPFPNTENVNDWKGVRVVDIPSEARRHVWLADTMLDEEQKESLAGVDGVIGCVTSRGSSVRECQRRAYRTLNNISLTDDIQFRKDIGNDVEEKKQQLVDWGWL